MKPVALMTAVSAGSWLAAVALFGVQNSFDVFLGMIAPLAMAVASWVAVERTYQRNPQGVTGVMIAGFLGKVVFFGAYVVIALKGLSVQPLPFVISFTSYFIGLYVIEAIYLQRLFRQ
jgi:hypothetical protein